MLIISLIIVIIDQITKKMAVSALKGNSGKVIIKNFFELTYIENAGAAFGILKNKKWLFLLITIIVVISILWYIVKNYKNMKVVEKLSLSFVLAGAIGNFIDRVINGYVVDFFSLKVGNYYFPIFNVADIAIVVGTGLLMFAIITSDEF